GGGGCGVGGGGVLVLLPGLRSLVYVLMFIPVEPAFLLALVKQPELITEALKNNIMQVCPTTLLVALRTIANQ
ncbi:DNA recombination protein RmuC, partial [Salmonella enterica]